jgi:hypothetical protein
LHTGVETQLPQNLKGASLQFYQKCSFFIKLMPKICISYL